MDADDVIKLLTARADELATLRTGTASKTTLVKYAAQEREVRRNIAAIKAEKLRVLRQMASAGDALIHP